MPKFDWTRYFPLIWLVFMVFPVLGILEQPRSSLEYVFAFGLQISFIAVFIWCYYIAPLDYGLELRPASSFGMIWALLVFAMLFPIIGWDGIGFLIYSGTFSGFQRSTRIFAINVTLISLFIAILVGLNILSWQFLIMPFFAVVGGMGNHMGYLSGLSNRNLQAAQANVERIAQLAERERIARDVHDLMGHSLSVIVLKAELASKLLDKNPIKAKQEILEIEQLARAGLQEVRAAVRGYKSLNLSSELENAQLALKAANIRLELQHSPLQLEWAQESALAYALREAITNTIRHSSAQVCWITLEPSGTNAQLEIWDDGGGVIKEGNGIEGMRQRLEKAGGYLKLETANGSHGMQLFVPLQQTVLS